MTLTLNTTRRYDGSIDQAFTALAAGTPHLQGHTFAITSPTMASITRKVAPRWTKVLAVAGLVLCLLNLAFVQNFVAILWAALALPLLFVRDTETAVVIASVDGPATRLHLSGVGSEELQGFVTEITEDVQAAA